MEPCRAAGLAANTSETTPDAESTTEEPVAEEESSSLDQIYDQLEQMKQRALQLRKALVREKPATAKYIKCLEDIKAHGSQNDEVRQVQLQTAEIASQVAELVQRLKSEGNRLKNLDCRIQQNQQQTQKLQTEIERLHSWPKCQKHRAAICLERYDDIRMTYYTHKDYRTFIQQFHKKFYMDEQTLVPIKCLRADKRQVVDRLKKIRKLMRASAQLLLASDNRLQKYVRDSSILRVPVFGSTYYSISIEEHPQE